jgi:Mitochondrial carrier protein
MNKKVQFFTIFCMVSTLLQSSSDRPLTLPEATFAGGVAGVLEVVCPGQPLTHAMNKAIADAAKKTAIEQSIAKPQSYKNVAINAGKYCLRSYTGFTAHAMGQMPIVAVQNMVYSQGTQALQARQNDPLSDFQKAGAAAVSGAAASLIDTPSNAVQLFLQRPQGKNKTNMQACKELGVKGLTRGATVNAGLKEAPFAMAYKFATPKVAKFLQEQGVENKVVATAIGGAGVGVVTAVVTQPGAVIRGTMQNDPHADVYKTVRQAASKIYERDGAQGFFRGLPQRGIRVACAVPLLVVYIDILEKCVKDR